MKRHSIQWWLALIYLIGLAVLVTWVLYGGRP